jgi:RNAse (barnase) inhibitor barstar
MANSKVNTMPTALIDARAERMLMVDLKGVRSKKALLEALASGLKLPKHFGHNWDALDDCINDNPWGKAESTTVVLLNATNAETRLGEHWNMLVDILEASATSWAKLGRTLRVALV